MAAIPPEKEALHDLITLQRTLSNATGTTTITMAPESTASTVPIGVTHMINFPPRNRAERRALKYKRSKTKR